jgi:hypothetical protein
MEYDVDYAMLIKLYGGNDGNTQTERKYSLVECTGGKRQEYRETLILNSVYFLC